MSDKRKSIGWRVVGAVFVPLVVFSAYLFFTRWPTRFDSGLGDWIALAVSSLAGSVFVALLPLKRVLRAILAVAYIVLSSVFLFFYSLYFVGLIFGDWL